MATDVTTRVVNTTRSTLQKSLHCPMGENNSNLKVRVAPFTYLLAVLSLFQDSLLSDSSTSGFLHHPGFDLRGTGIREGRII